MLAQLALTGGPVSMPEGNSGITAFTFSVTRSVNTNSVSSVQYAVTGSAEHSVTSSDFEGTQLPVGEVPFNQGETSKTITINVLGDAQVEQDEGFTLSLF